MASCYEDFGDVIQSSCRVAGPCILSHGRPSAVSHEEKATCQGRVKIAITRATNEYYAEQRKDEKRSLHAICREVQEEYRAEAGKPVVVDHMTVLR